MKNNIKIVALVISMLLLVGAVIGISVSANDNPSIEIASKNISYEGAVKTLYAVKTENADGLTAKISFYDADPANGGALLYTKSVAEQITLGEETLDVVFSKGFAPNELRKSIFAVPTLVDANGAVVATGATVEYSPYIYAMNRFNKSATADQLNLYTALLDYGAAVQRVINTADEVAANGGYADEYYEIDAKRAFAYDISNQGKLKSGTFSKADIDAGKIRAGDTYDISGFAAWADADGNVISFAKQTLTTNDVKPGKTTVIALYGSYATANTKSCDFASGNPVNWLIAAYNVATVCDNTKASFANAEKPGLSSVTDTDGVITYTKVINPEENFGTNSEYLDANYQYLRFYTGGAYTSADIYVAETDIKFENVKGDDTFQISLEGWKTSYSSLQNVVITPSEEKDENGYATAFTLGNATLASGTSYRLRLEWLTDSDIMRVFVDGALAYSSKSGTPVEHDISYNSFKLVGNAKVEGVVTIDNLTLSTICIHNNHTVNLLDANAYIGDHYFNMVCTDCGLTNPDLYYLATDNRGNGTYYNDQTNGGTRYDMTALPYGYKHTSGQTWEIVDEALAITSSAWAPMSIRPSEGKITAAAGQKYVIEFDIMYSGSDNTGNDGNYVFAGLVSAEKGSNGTQSPPFYWNSASSNYMTLGVSDAAIAKDVWYNFRYEYTVNADGSANYVTYVNNNAVESLTGKVDAAIAECYGWSICGRDAGNATVNLDNMYIGVICAENHNLTENTDNISAYIGEGKFYKSCTNCAKIDTTTTFTVDTDAAKGTGTYFADPAVNTGKADVENTSPFVTFGKDNGGLAYNMNDGTLNITAISWAYLTFTSQNAITLAAGEKYVQEFDFMYDGATDHPAGNGRVYAGLSNNANGSNSALISGGGDGIMTTEKYAYFHLDGGTNTKTKLYADIWYNVRVEYIVNADGTSATYSIYVNDELDTTATDGSPATTIAGWLMQPSRQANETLYFKFDNFFTGKVCDTHAYEDAAISGLTYAGNSENGVATFYTKACTACGNLGGETVEYAGVTRGEGTYYADEIKEGKRQDYSTVTVGVGFDQALGGTNGSGTDKLYSIKDFGGDKALNLITSGWTTATVRPNGLTKFENLATGDKLIIEFDLRVDATYHADTVAAKLNFASTYKTSDSKQISDQIALKSTATGDSTLGTSTLIKGVWYNVRFELTVNGDLAIYVNGELSATMTGYTIPDTAEMACYGLGIVTRGTVDMSIDNMYMAHIPAAN